MLVGDAEDVHVLMNNCSRDCGVPNVQDRVDRLVERRAEAAAVIR
jgi:hypothetical protein